MAQLVRSAGESLAAKLHAEMEELHENTLGSLDWSNKMHDLALQRLDRRVMERDERQERLDADFGEALRGLTVEIRKQIRASSATDAHVGRLCQQVEDQLQPRLARLERVVQEAALDSSAAALRQLQARAEDADRRQRAADAARDSLSRRMDEAAIAVESILDKLEGQSHHAQRTAEADAQVFRRRCEESVTAVEGFRASLEAQRRRCDESAVAVEAFRASLETNKLRCEEAVAAVEGLRTSLETHSRQREEREARAAQLWASDVERLQVQVQALHRRCEESATAVEGLQASLESQRRQSAEQEKRTGQQWASDLERLQAQLQDTLERRARKSEEFTDDVRDLRSKVEIQEQNQDERRQQWMADVEEIWVQLRDLGRRQLSFEEARLEAIGDRTTSLAGLEANAERWQGLEEVGCLQAKHDELLQRSEEASATLEGLRSRSEEAAALFDGLQSRLTGLEARHTELAQGAAQQGEQWGCTLEQLTVRLLGLEERHELLAEGLGSGGTQVQMGEPDQRAARPDVRASAQRASRRGSLLMEVQEADKWEIDESSQWHVGAQARSALEALRSRAEGQEQRLAALDERVEQQAEEYRRASLGAAPLDSEAARGCSEGALNELQSQVQDAARQLAGMEERLEALARDLEQVGHSQQLHAEDALRLRCGVEERLQTLTRASEQLGASQRVRVEDFAGRLRGVEKRLHAVVRSWEELGGPQLVGLEERLTALARSSQLLLDALRSEIQKHAPRLAASVPPGLQVSLKRQLSELECKHEALASRSQETTAAVEELQRRLHCGSWQVVEPLLPRRADPDERQAARQIVSGVVERALSRNQARGAAAVSRLEASSPAPSQAALMSQLVRVVEQSLASQPVSPPGFGPSSASEADAQSQTSSVGSITREALRSQPSSPLGVGMQAGNRSSFGSAVVSQAAWQSLMRQTTKMDSLFKQVSATDDLVATLGGGGDLTTLEDEGVFAGIGAEEAPGRARSSGSQDPGKLLGHRVGARLPCRSPSQELASPIGNATASSRPATASAVSPPSLLSPAATPSRQQHLTKLVACAMKRSPSVPSPTRSRAS